MLNKFDDWFCANWRSFLTWWSIWLHTIGTSLAGLFLLVPQMPAELQEMVPVKVRIVAIAVWYVGGIWARLKQQKGGGNAH